MTIEDETARLRRGASLFEALPEGHVVKTLMDEHRRILAKLARLARLAELTPPGTADREVVEEIRDIGRHLIAAEPHHRREEQVLFPELRKRGITGPPNVMESEHAELRILKHAVAEGASKTLDDPQAWPETLRAARSLVTMLRDHIAKEDEILYPLAVQSIDDPEAWAEMKRRCDEIGYCCHGRAHD